MLHSSVSCCLVLALLSCSVAAAEDAYLREARLAGAALEAQQAAGVAPAVALEVAELPPAEAMPGAAKDGAWIVWTVSTLATKDRDATPAIRFVLVPRGATLGWRSTVDTSGVWFEPELFQVEDEFAVFQRRGPSMEEDVVAARDAATQWIGGLFGRTTDPGQDVAPELAKQGLAAGVTSAKAYSRHLVLEVGGDAPYPIDDLAKAYRLHWIGLMITPPSGPESVVWRSPSGAGGRTPEPGEAHTAPDTVSRMAEAEAAAAGIGRRLVEAWRAKPKADVAERMGWVEKAGPELLEAYQKTGQYVPGMTRHEQDQKRFARYLRVLD